MQHSQSYDSSNSQGNNQGNNQPEYYGSSSSQHPGSPNSRFFTEMNRSDLPGQFQNIGDIRMQTSHSQLSYDYQSPYDSQAIHAVQPPLHQRSPEQPPPFHPGPNFQPGQAQFFAAPNPLQANAPYLYPPHGDNFNALSPMAANQTQLFRDPGSPGLQAEMGQWTWQQREVDPTYGAEFRGFCPSTGNNVPHSVDNYGHGFAPGSTSTEQPYLSPYGPVPQGPQGNTVATNELSSVPTCNTLPSYHQDLPFAFHEWSFNNKLPHRNEYWASNGAIFSGEAGGQYRYLSPDTLAGQELVARALDLTRQDFREYTGTTPPVTPGNLSYEYQYNCMQLDLVSALCYDGRNTKVPKLLCVGPFEKWWDDWAAPDGSVRVKVEAMGRQ